MTVADTDADYVPPALSTEAPFQVSDKWGEAIFVVRGNSAEEFVLNMISVFGQEGTDSRLLGIASKQTPKDVVSQAVDNLKSGGVVSEPTSSNSNAKRCGHGEMVYKSGTAKSSGKQWKAWDCPDGVCDREWIR